MTTTSGASLTVTDGVAELRLDAPQTGNALGPQLSAELREHAQALQGRDDVRAVLLSASGKAFCVGGDIRHFASAADPEAALHAVAGDLHAALLALTQLDAPVVARVQGAAAGAGLSLVCAADVAIASTSASFTSAYTRIGLSPDGGQSWLLPRLIGLRRATDMLLNNPRVDAAEALRIGLVTEVVDDNALDARVHAVVAALADGPTPAFGATKRLLRASSTATFEEQLSAEADTIAGLAASPVGREGVAAFLGKRPPEFRSA
jgi:2-(1,2-epoxy-1,2-dihydrophenyl)acetyl-CoA isomerase